MFLKLCQQGLDLINSRNQNRRKQKTEEQRKLNTIFLPNDYSLDSIQTDFHYYC